MRDIITELISQIKAEQAKLAGSLTAGHAINFETYQRLVGNHQGLQAALNILEGIMTEDDEEQNQQ
jgi:hypothetical protein